MIESNKKYELKDGKVLVAMSVLSAASSLFFNALPVIVGSLTLAVSFNEEEQGIITGGAGIGTLLICLTAAIWIPRVNWKHTASSAFIPIFLGLAVLAFAKSLMGLVVGLFLFNAGAAVLLVISLTVISRAPDPSRAFGIKTVFEIGLAALIALIITQVAQPMLGYLGFILVMVGFFVLSFFAIRFLPDNFIKQEDLDESAPAEKAGLRGWLALASLFVLFATLSSVWAYLGRIGAQNGLNEALIGTVLSASILTAIVGAGIVAIMGLKFGHAIPIMIGFALSIVCLFGLKVHDDTTTFVLSASLLAIMIQYQSNYLMGLVAENDPSDRLVVLIPLVFVLSVVLGSGLGGPAIAAFGYDQFLNITIGFVVLGGLIALPVILYKAGTATPLRT